jgi:enoyl-CoA hydratase
MRDAEQGGADGKDVVLYETQGPVAIISINRPERANAQNDEVTYALDACFKRAALDDAVASILLRSTGKHFSSGHDIGARSDFVAPAQDRVTMWYNSEGKEGGERTYSREQEVYLGMCRRWRDIPKPTVAAVRGACIAGGLMLAWICDIIVASDDASFSDPVVSMGVPGVEYFAHAFEMQPRIAREFLMLGERMTARRAYEVGMVNRVVAAEALDQTALEIAMRLSERPRFALALTKQAMNLAEDIMGKRASMESTFAFHHLAPMLTTKSYPEGGLSTEMLRR